MNPWVIITGAVATVITTFATVVGKARGQRTDQIIATLTEVRAWSEDLRESEEACRRELMSVRAELDTVRQEQNRLREKVRHLEEQVKP